MIVKALDTYKKFNIKDNELGKIPESGEKFEVTKERFEVLTTTNKYNKVFVEEIEEIIETATKKVKTEKAIKNKRKEKWLIELIQK